MKFNKIILTVLAITIFLFLYFYPPMYGIMDEGEYLNTAFSLRKGSFFYDEVKVPPSTATVITEKHQFSKYPPGNSILLVPFTSVHWKLGFLRTFLFFLGGFIIFYFLIKSYSIDPVFSVLYLLYPTLILYSRTVMSDIPSMFFLLLGIFLIVRRKPCLAGFVLGFSIIIRYTNAVAIFGVMLSYIIKRDYKSLLSLLPGIIFFILFNCIYNISILGGLLAPLVMPTGATGFGISYVKTSGLFYIFALNLFYPCMLIIAIIYGLKKRNYLIFSIPSLLILLVYSFYYYFDKGSFIFETVVRGGRFIIPVMPLILIIYASFLNRSKFLKTAFVISIPLLLVLSAGIQIKHNQFLRDREEIRNIIYDYTADSDLIICNGEAGELISPFFGAKEWRDFYAERRVLLDTLEIKQSVSPFLVYVESGKHPDELIGYRDSVVTLFNLDTVVVSESPQHTEIYRILSLR